MAVETGINTKETTPFWHDFWSTGWDKKPMLLRDPAARLDLAAEDLFNAVVQAAETIERPEGEGPRLRFYIDRRMVAADLAEVLPRASDRSIAGFIERTEAELAPHEWMLFIDQIHTVSFEIWSAARDFIHGFAEASHILPAGPSDVDVFLGHYSNTPGGIHADPCGNFMFTVYGTKGMRMWPPEAGPKLPQKTRKYESVRDQGELFTGDQSTAVYFPGRWYHVGESPQEPSVSVNVALFLEDDPMGKVIRELRRRAQQKASIPKRSTYEISENVAELPEGYGEAVTAVAAAAGDSPSILGAMHAAWMRRITSYGFESLPPVATVDPVTDASRVRLRDKRYPVLSQPNGGEIVVFANGRSASVKQIEGVARAIELVNVGDEIAVMDLFALNRSTELNGDFRDLVKALLWRLRSWRAITVSGVHS